MLFWHTKKVRIMIRNIILSLVLLSSCTFITSTDSKKHNFSLSDGISKTIRNETILVALAAYTLVARPEWLHDYPVISALCGACLLGSVIKNTFANSLDYFKNSFIRTAVKCPFSTGLAIYALAFNRELIRENPVISTIVGLWLALQWSENVE